MNLQIEKRSTKTIVLYFQIHQPQRLRAFSYFDIGTSAPYFDGDLNRKIIHRIANNCYLPVNKILLDLIERHPEIRICFSISGVALEQFRLYAPEVIKSFKSLVDTGAVEMLCETSHHSLASEMPGDEFELQVVNQRNRIVEFFETVPTVFRNTELIYSNSVGDRIAGLGFKGVMVEGSDQLLRGRSPYQLFQHSDNLTIISRSYQLSDDIGFRYQRGGSTLSVGQYLSWLESIPENQTSIVLGLDYETFGEHQKKSTGIIDFLKGLIEAIWLHPGFLFKTPSELIEETMPTEKLDVPSPISWADAAKDLSAWLGNNLQNEAFAMLEKVGSYARAVDDADLLETWRLLQTSDHLYYMCTKNFGDGDVHSYFSPYPSPYEAFINYMNILSDFEILVCKKQDEQRAIQSESQIALERERRDALPEPLWAEPFKQEYQQPHLSN